MLNIKGCQNAGPNYLCILYEFYFFFFCNSWDHKTAIYPQLQSDNGRHTKTGYDTKVNLVGNNLEPMEVQESD